MVGTENVLRYADCTSG